MTETIKVLVVDDSVVVRQFVSSVINADPELEVTDVAANGRIALKKLNTCRPDVITLDLEMPEMDGLETLRELRKTHPNIPVIMFSAYTTQGASHTLEALSLGAADYCLKPSQLNGETDARVVIREELLTKIKALQKRSTAHSAPKPQATSPIQRRTPIVASDQPCEIIALGISTGGPRSLGAVIPQLPASFPVPIVCVQHMPPVFTKTLAERLNQQSQITVTEGTDGMPVEPGTMYIAPGGFHMVLKPAVPFPVISLNEEAPENSCRPAVDPLFRSVADIYKRSACGVVMTGMGYDGKLGALYLKKHSARVIIQDEKSSVVWGMPGAVYEAQAFDEIVPLDQMAAVLLRIASNRKESRART